MIFKIFQICDIVPTPPLLSVIFQNLCTISIQVTQESLDPLKQIAADFLQIVTFCFTGLDGF